MYQGSDKRNFWGVENDKLVLIACNIEKIKTVRIWEMRISVAIPLNFPLSASERNREREGNRPSPSPSKKALRVVFLPCRRGWRRLTRLAGLERERPRQMTLAGRLDSTRKC